MIVDQFYLGCLSQASYLVADEVSRRAVVVDPSSVACPSSLSSRLARLANRARRSDHRLKRGRVSGLTAPTGDRHASTLPR